MDLRELLRKAYRPPEPRPQFQSELFERLQMRSRALRQARLRRRRIRRLVATSSVALAASVVLAAAVLVRTYEPVSSGPSEPAASPAVWQGRVRGALQVREPGSAWAPAAERIAVTGPLVLRADGGQAGVEPAPGVRLVLDEGSEVEIRDRRIALAHGLISLRVGEHAQPVDLALPTHTVHVAPSSWIGVELESGARYAAGGRPAPAVTLLSGGAQVDDGAQYVALEPGRVYHLHPYPRLDRLPGEALDHDALAANTHWVQPTLVSFQTRPEANGR